MIDVFMRYPGWKAKAVTFSYDDGVEQDRRLMEIFDRYGLKATFNINSGLIAPEGVEYPKDHLHRRLSLSGIKELYLDSDHEIAAHSLKHKFMNVISDSEVINEIIEDRKNLEHITSKTVRGFAYPYGVYADKTEQILEMCGIVYARTADAQRTLAVPKNLLRIKPTCHHSDDMLEYFINKTVKKTPLSEYHDRNPWLLYIWGHSFEFEANNSWDLIEHISESLSGKDDIWYATNIEIFDYIKSYRSLVFSADGGMIYNPTAKVIYLESNSRNLKVNPGETINAERITTDKFVLEEK